jgi:hypothetical protein
MILRGYFISIAVSTVLFVMSLPAITIGETYISETPPSDTLILKSAPQMKNCEKHIKKIVGKLQVSSNEWIVYYEYAGIEGKNRWGNEMKLKKLDTNIWICECGDKMYGESWGAIDK